MTEQQLIAILAENPDLARENARRMPSDATHGAESDVLALSGGQGAERGKKRSPHEKYASLTLPYPPSANRYWRKTRGRMVVSSEARRYKRDVASLVSPINVAFVSKSLVAVTMVLYRPRRSGDLDNRLKVVLDSLNGIAYEDDKQVVEIHAFRHDDKKNPRVEIEISEIGS